MRNDDSPDTAVPPTDRITLRFLAAPADVTASGSTVPAGRVMEWIDKVAYACGLGWSGTDCVTAFVGDVNFTRPILPGDLVEAHARVVLTGRSSMHILVSIETTDARRRTFKHALHCILVLVALDEQGRPQEVPTWQPWDDGDRTLRDRAQARIEPRQRIREAMEAQVFSDAGTTPRVVFRFLAAPGDANWGGTVHGGTVMRWIDETAFTCAASWSSANAVAVYSGGINFYRPIPIGHIVEIDARLIHTGERSMHISVQVRSGSPTDPHNMALTTQCTSVFVDRGQDGRALPIKALPLPSEEDRALDTHAVALIDARAKMSVMPFGLARRS